MAEDMKRAMAEWIDLKRNLTEARKDLSTLNKREKELRTYIQGFMIKNEVDTVKVDAAKVSVKTTNKTSPLTKETLKNGLLVFFEQDETRADACFETIMENLPKKESKSISITGLKKTNPE
jgi:CO dehydrogenase/acetyl-CoA synthase beta subunit